MTGRYERDTYYLETCDALAEAGVAADAFARRHSILLLKPDAAITGAMRPAVSWLVDHGYRIVGAYAADLTPMHIRALWYFNWHHATRERRRLADRLAHLSASVVLLVTHPDDSVPVSVRLTAEKGPADPARREPGQLRQVLAAGTYLLNLVHTPDDPDDVLRELSIYFAEPLLSEVIAECLAGADAGGDALLIAQRVELEAGRKTGDLTDVEEALWADLGGSDVTQRPQSGEEWLGLLEEAGRRGVHVDTWFRTVIESAYLPMHRE